MEDLFKDAEIISAYTRANALEDGVLVDISSLAKEAGFNSPVAVTRALFEILDPEEDLKSEGQDLNGRVWDMLWIFRNEIRKSNGGDTINFTPLFILRPNGSPEPVKLWAKAGPGDNMELVMTIMLEGED